jgi:methyltransferase (TIGR00027 family)
MRAVRDTASGTASLVCLARALEADKPEDVRIVRDPYARLFLGPLARLAHRTGSLTQHSLGAAEPLRALTPALWSSSMPPLATYVLARHRSLDEAMRATLADGAAQVVLLGAGYDMRAFRFADALAGRPLFEVDLPAMSARKTRLLDKHTAALPPAERRAVPLDLRTARLAEALRDAGFVPERPTCWLWEGVSMYLRREAVEATLRAVRELSAPGSRLGMDFWFLPDGEDLLSAAHRAGPAVLQMLGEPLTFSLHPGDAPDFLRRLGFTSEEVLDASALEARYVRDDRRVYPACYVALARV